MTTLPLEPPTCLYCGGRKFRRDEAYCEACVREGVTPGKFFGHSQSLNGKPSDLNHTPFATKDEAEAWLKERNPSFEFISQLGYWQTTDGYIDAKIRYRDGLGYWWEFAA